MSEQSFLPLLSPLPIVLFAGPEVACDFEGWWKEYPRHVGKGQARRAYSTARQKTDCGSLLISLRCFVRALQYRGTEQQFICHAATWLNGERWLDEYPDIPLGGGGLVDDAGNELTSPRSGSRADASIAAGLAAGARVRAAKLSARH